MCFINNASQPLGDCGGWRMAMWCLIIKGTWEIKSSESTQHPRRCLLPVKTSSYLPPSYSPFSLEMRDLYAFIFPTPHPSTANYVLTNQQMLVNGRRGKKKRMKDRFLSAHIKGRTVWKLLWSSLFTTTSVSATRDIISFTVMLKHNTIMR